LAQVVPEKVPALWARWCAPATAGINPRSGRYFADIHFMSKGGGGAMAGYDGWDHIGTPVTLGGLRAPDPELHELATPYHLLEYQYCPDSAGAGQWRGGLGVNYRWRVEAEGIACANFGSGVHPETAPFGLQGGHAAPPHKLYLRKAGEVIDVDAESFYSLDKGDVFEIYESGGGGYGQPRHRDPARVASDVFNGLVSADKAREDYGVALDPETGEVDVKATALLRAGA
jgi:N-methylhydantoinase B